MAGSNNKTQETDEPRTASTVLHRPFGYDFMSNLMGMGPKGRNSRLVVALAGIKSGDAVLDAGCGTGSLTLAASRAAGSGGRVHGIDASAEMITAARRKASREGMDVAFDLGLMEKLDFQDAHFDAVISRLAIHHLPDDLKLRGFAEFLRVLKPGGRLLIADLKAQGKHFLGHVASALAGSHVIQTGVQDLPPMLAAAGFAEVAFKPVRSRFMAYLTARKPAL